MDLRATFNLASIKDKLEKTAKLFETELIEGFHKLGEECISKVYKNSQYIDDDGELRSATGYVILKDGEEVGFGGFAKVYGSTKGINDERKKGKAMADDLAEEYSEGFVLLVIVGSEYAASVEAKGYDVLTSSEAYAKTIVPKILREMKIVMQ